MTSLVKGVFIVGAKRTPFGKYGGKFVKTPSLELQTVAAKAALTSANINPELIDSVIIGNVITHSSSDGAGIPRHVSLKLGIPQERSAFLVNRLCGSGFQSIVNGTQEILTGASQIVLTGGTENMSQTPYLLRNARYGNALGQNLVIEESLLGTDTYCDLSMAQTAEKLGALYKVTRDDADEFALRSQQLWKAAHDNGRFNEELASVPVKVKKEVINVDVDEHPRPQSTMEALKKLPSVFKKDGLVTAGNASGICDGAGAVIVASEDAVKKHSLKPLARIVAWSVVGVDPSIMGIGPVPAIRNILKVTGKTLNDIDLIEINEAFAAQVLACLKELKPDMAKFNVDGGAVALGHPLGASGARIITHLAYELRRRKAKLGIGSACIGGGQGIAVLIESV